MLEKAVRICDGTFGIPLGRKRALHLTSSHNTPPEYAERRRQWPMRLDKMPGSMRWRAVAVSMMNWYDFGSVLK
jgi:hypothetical protein